jgi:hypothetical protein
VNKGGLILAPRSVADRELDRDASMYDLLNGSTFSRKPRADCFEFVLKRRVACRPQRFVRRLGESRWKPRADSASRRSGVSRRASERTALITTLLVVVTRAIRGPNLMNARVRRDRTASYRRSACSTLPDPAIANPRATASSSA